MGQAGLWLAVAAAVPITVPIPITVPTTITIPAAVAAVAAVAAAVPVAISVSVAVAITTPRTGIPRIARATGVSVVSIISGRISVIPVIAIVSIIAVAAIIPATRLTAAFAAFPPAVSVGPGWWRIITPAAVSPDLVTWPLFDDRFTAVFRRDLKLRDITDDSQRGSSISPSRIEVAA